MTTYLVTGGAGFIGSHLTYYLARAGYPVRVLDNFSASSRDEFRAVIALYAHNIEIIEGDLRDADACRRACEGMEYILHHAAMASVPLSVERPDECMAVNVQGTTNLLIAARDAGVARRFVFASSSAVYGETPGLSKNEATFTDPLSPYATSKLTGEFLCRNFHRLYGLPTVALRYFNVYGPRQDPNSPYAAVIPKFLDALTVRLRPIVYGDGEQSRDFIFVDDVVEANLRACDAPARNAGGQVFNIGSGKKTSLNQLLEILSMLLGTSIEAERQDARPGDVKHSRADITKAAGVLQFSPNVSLEEGLRRLLIAERLLAADQAA